LCSLLRATTDLAAESGEVSAAITRDGDHPRYRSDIDGLRAFAVVTVVLYHAGLGHASFGFYGVDIFFVISGYLIGGIIIKSVDEERFSFADFYARRARRILPALFAVVTALCLVGWFTLGPAEYRDVGATSLSSLLAYSNLSFWHQATNYFDDEYANLRPLLMTWSLGVEEQFYVFFPFLVIGAMKFARRWIVHLFLLIILVSFIADAWCMTRDPPSAFFLLPFRAWELGVGTTLAAAEIVWSRSAGRWASNRLIREIAGVLGAALLVFSVFGSWGQAHLLAFAALPPVLGALILIWAETSTVNRVALSAPPVVFVGKISYSWYLWHWPLFSLIHIYAVDDSAPSIMAGATAASFIIAIFSWQFIEQPFRRRRNNPIASGRTLWRYAVALAVLLTMTDAIKADDGVAMRLPPKARHVQAVVLLDRGDCLADFKQPHPDRSPHCLAERPGQPTLALIGDSHASALAPGLRRVAARMAWGVAILSKSSCGPLLDVAQIRDDIPSFDAACRQFMRETAEILKQDQTVRMVVIAGDWNSYEHLGPSFRDGLLKMVAALKSSGKAVIIMRDVPHFEINPVHMGFAQTIGERGPLARLLWSHPQPYPIDGTSVLSMRQDAVFDRYFADISKETGAMIFDGEAPLCRGSSCRFEQSGELLYRDPHHLSTLGSEMVAGAMVGIFQHPRAAEPLNAAARTP
jgi:peptidoglycan/LPS O-acetylase OafA/YrhL